MPTKVEKDHLSGTNTTGHEWDGIKELNTPLPKWWLYVFFASIVWTIAYYVVYPAIPLGDTHTDGMLGWTQREQIEEQMWRQRVLAGQEPGVELTDQEDLKWMASAQKVGETEYTALQNDQELFRFARRGGKAVFADNCAPCHAAGGAGNPGYPQLADDAWLFGGSPDTIEKSIRHGINSEHPDTRMSMMTAYGDILSAEEIDATAEFVLKISGQEHDAAKAEEGATIYGEQCSFCHGAKGDGSFADPEIDNMTGAPRLNDSNWIYDGSKEAIVTQITQPKQGVMPTWEGRLSDTQIKMVTAYVHSLGGGQ